MSTTVNTIGWRGATLVAEALKEALDLVDLQISSACFCSFLVFIFLCLSFSFFLFRQNPLIDSPPVAPRNVCTLVYWQVGSAVEFQIFTLVHTRF